MTHLKPVQPVVPGSCVSLGCRNQEPQFQMMYTCMCTHNRTKINKIEVEKASQRDIPPPPPFPTNPGCGPHVLLQGTPKVPPVSSVKLNRQTDSGLVLSQPNPRCPICNFYLVLGRVPAEKQRCSPVVTGGTLT